MSLAVDRSPFTVGRRPSAVIVEFELKLVPWDCKFYTSMKKLILSSFFAIFALIIACNAPSETDEQPAATGEALAKVYCIGCHQYPEPDLLDKKTWEGYVLPRMGYFYGIYENDTIRNTLIEEGQGGVAVEQAKVFPAEPTLGKEIWEKIQAFYLENAPEALVMPEYPALEKDLKQFDVKPSPLRLSPPSSTMVHLLEEGLFVGDALTKKLYQFDRNLELQIAANVREGAVWLEEKSQEYFLTVMGSFSPTDAPSGFLISLPKDKNQRPKVLLKNLQRPVHSNTADFNGDGLEDIVVCEFAKWTGSLSWWENKGNDQYERRVLKDQPGAIKAYARDLDKDGDQDVIALFGQGNEGVFIFYNQGNGQFKEEQALAFHPSYGSSFFDLFDMEGDGDLDIIYTCGDNADYPPILKPYHGIRIFENKGKYQFEETFFYQLNGAYNAVPEDFDGDGDLDIAAISFFPDFQNRPEESFVYLENQGNFQMKASTFPEVNDGRWIVMESGDIDKDGDTDLILGALTFEVVPKLGYVQQWVEKGVPFVVLENDKR